MSLAWKWSKTKQEVLSADLQKKTCIHTLSNSPLIHMFLVEVIFELEILFSIILICVFTNFSSFLYYIQFYCSTFIGGTWNFNVPIWCRKNNASAEIISAHDLFQYKILMGRSKGFSLKGFNDGWENMNVLFAKGRKPITYLVF